MATLRLMSGGPRALSACPALGSRSKVEREVTACSASGGRPVHPFAMVLTR